MKEPKFYPSIATQLPNLRDAGRGMNFPCRIWASRRIFSQDNEEIAKLLPLIGKNSIFDLAEKWKAFST
jgi:hypothetical protein